MRYKVLTFWFLGIILTSCEGIKHICIYNLSRDTISITTSKVRTDLPDMYIDKYSSLRLEPSDTMTEKSRIQYYKRLFETDNCLTELPNGIDFKLKPNTSIKIGTAMWAVFPETIKTRDLYIDSLSIAINSDTIKTKSRTEIIKLTNDKRFRYIKADKEYIKLNSRLFRNIVIR